MVLEYGIGFWALTFDVLGKILIAVTALLAHGVIVREKRIDKIVLKDLRYEVSLGILGILFIVIGYVLHLKILNGA